ncbi:hypothetical protein AZG88_27055 [Rhodococcus sp. LB1]|nr:hypothetical protein AZG88_27055 [Rhodococcus sp. LB1]
MVLLHHIARTGVLTVTRNTDRWPNPHRDEIGAQRAPARINARPESGSLTGDVLSSVGIM